MPMSTSYQAPDLSGLSFGGGGGSSRPGSSAPTGYFPKNTKAGGSFSGFPGGGMSFGSPTAQAGFGMADAMGPLWQQKQMVPHAGEAYDVASQLLGPGYQQGGAGGGTPWGDMMMKMMGPRMGSQHPGMGDEEWRQGMGAIGTAAEGEKARAMSLLGSTGGGSVDPRAASSALSRISEGVPSAVANLAAKRSGLDLQAILGMGGLQQPMARQELMGQQQQMQGYGSELRGLAGNIMQSGQYPAGDQQAALRATRGSTPGTSGFWNTRR